MLDVRGLAIVVLLAAAVGPTALATGLIGGLYSAQKVPRNYHRSLSPSRFARHRFPFSLYLPP